MSTKEIFQDIIGQSSKVNAEPNSGSRSLTSYKSASEILNRTYIALGRRRVAKFSNYGSTKENINVKQLSNSTTTATTTI